MITKLQGRRLQKGAIELVLEYTSWQLYSEAQHLLSLPLIQPMFPRFQDWIIKALFIIITTQSHILGFASKIKSDSRH